MVNVYFVYVVDVISIVVDLVISVQAELKNVTPTSGFDMFTALAKRCKKTDWGDGYFLSKTSQPAVALTLAALLPVRTLPLWW